MLTPRPDGATLCGPNMEASMDEKMISDLANHAGRKALDAVQPTLALCDEVKPRIAIMGGAIGVMLAYMIFDIAAHVVAPAMGKTVDAMTAEEVDAVTKTVMENVSAHTAVGILCGHKRALERKATKR